MFEIFLCVSNYFMFKVLLSFKIYAGLNQYVNQITLVKGEADLNCCGISSLQILFSHETYQKS